MRRAGASSAVSRATKVAPLCWICSGRWSQRFMHGAGGNFHRNYQPDIDRLIDRLTLPQSPAFPRHDPQGNAWISPTKSPAPKLIQAWGFARDQGRWDDLAAIFHPGGEIAVSWFRGPYPEFVAHCRQQFRQRQRGQASALAGARRGERRRAPPPRPTSPSWCARPSRASRSTSPPTAASSTGSRTPRRRLAHRRARGAVREGPARSGRAVGKVRRDDGEVGRREISGAVSLHGLSRARRRPLARRAGALRRPRRDRGAQGALRGVAEGK